MDFLIAEEGSGYKLTWPQINVEVKVSRIRNRKDGIKAECQFWLQGSGRHRSNFFMDSDNQVAACVRGLQEKLPEQDYLGGTKWSSIIHDLTGVIIDKVRAGTPEISLGDFWNEREDENLWRVDNLLVNDVNVLWADGGSGKSYFALFLATLISEGAEYANSDHGLLVQPGNVLFLDYETNYRSIVQRLRKIHRGLGIERATRIVYRKQSTAIVDDVDELTNMVYRNNIDVIVVDSMGLAVAGELESQETVSEFFRVLKSICETTLVITHSNKAGFIFGSIYTQNHARSVWQAEKQAGSLADKSIDFTLMHRKANDIAVQPMQSWSVNFEDEDVVYTRIETIDTGSAGQLSYKKLVLELLKKKAGQTREDLIEQISQLKEEHSDKSRPNVRSAVSSLKEGGRVSEDDGRLSLKEGELWNNNTEPTLELEI